MKKEIQFFSNEQINVPPLEGHTIVAAIQHIHKDSIYDTIAKKTYVTEIWNDLVFNRDQMDTRGYMIKKWACI